MVSKTMIVGSNPTSRANLCNEDKTMKLYYVTQEYTSQEYYESDLDMHIWANSVDEALAIWKTEGALEVDIEDYTPLAFEVPLTAPKKPKRLSMYHDMPLVAGP